MKQDQLLNIFTTIDDNFITEAKHTAKRRRMTKKIGLTAMVTVILILCIWLIPKESMSTNESVHLGSLTSPIQAPTEPPSPPLPSAPSTPTKPQIPSNIPGTIVLNQKITSNTPLQGCIGSIYDTQYSASSGEIPIFGVTVTAKPIEVIDGIYMYLDDRFQRNYRIIRMKTVECHFGAGVPDEFFLLYANYSEPDFLEFDTIIMNELTQYGYENQILLNVESKELQAFEHILFESYHLAGIKDGICVGTLGEHNSYRGKSEEQIVNEFVQIMGNTKCSKVQSLSSITNSAALEALQWIEPFKNGVFVQHLDYYTMLSSNLSAGYRRYLNGYPTNETISIFQNGARYSTQVFAQKDIANLPDLPSALCAINEAFNKGEIQPPHLVVRESLSLTKYTIHGWYTKSGDAVFGIIRVGWCYEEKKGEPYLDDKYYLIEQNSDQIIPIESQELITILEDGASDFIFSGEYNENGMNYPMMPMC